MTEKYQNTYRVGSTRLPYWDYGANALYFVTMCCKNRSCYFGNISDGKMILSEIGKMAEKYWVEIPRHFPFVVLHNHVIMPNHVHGIIEIAKPNNGGMVDNNGMTDGMMDGMTDGTMVETPKLGVSTATAAATAANTAANTTPNPTSTENKKRTHHASKKWKSNTLGSIINQYKRICTINARKINADFAWQPRFYDHIIRNDESYQRISHYIINNPIHWEGDKFHSANQF